jgi:phosphoribosylanthranilate isomerase
MAILAKICGITSREALDAAIAGGASHVGFVFFEKSPRHLELAEASKLAELARGRAKIVVLTVDADDETMRLIDDEIQPDIFQLHGDEPPGRVGAVKRQFAREVIKAIPVQTAEDVERAAQYKHVADLILFDAKPAPDAARPGGNGQAFDWKVLDGVPPDVPYMLSGGLTPDNVEQAISSSRAIAVDVSSGVESAPGVKSTALIGRFLLAAKAAKQS